MESSNDYALIEELRAMRPAPRPAFAAELDERAAAGFPRRSRMRRFSRWMDRVRDVQPRRLLVPAGGATLAVLAIATAFALRGEMSDSSGQSHLQSQIDGGVHLSSLSGGKSFNGAGPDAKRTAGSGPVLAGEPNRRGSAGLEFETAAAPAASNLTAAPEKLSAYNGSFRINERSAELALAATPGDVESDASRVVSTVHRFGGIVMRSNTTEGRRAGAYFSLLLPSAKVSDALDAISRIDRVSSREESTADITAPTFSAVGRLKESKAQVESLLGQLSAAETDAERQALEAELAPARRRAAAQRRQLAELHRRARFSQVEVRIESANDVSGSGSWGIDDALHDAGHVLSAAAGVILIALAVLGPIALIVFVAWLARRAWLTRARRRALG